MSEHVKYLNDDNFNETISLGVTLVDFYADWCGPCRMITPIIEELAEELHDKANIAKLDIETSQKTTSSLQITSIPTLILFKNGEEVTRVVGVKDKETLSQLVTSNL